MNSALVPASPQLYARAAGFIYLLVILLGGFAHGYVHSALVAPGDVAATLRNIEANATLWQAGVAAASIVPLIAFGQLWLEYLLLHPAGAKGALLFLLLNLGSLSVEVLSKVFLLMVAPLADAGNAEAHATAGLALAASEAAFSLALILFGAACLVIGRLIFKSGYLPKALGGLMGLAGVCYLITSAAALFAPSVLAMITPGALLPILVGEASLCLWLLIRGVDLAGWRARTTLAANRAQFGG